MKDLFECLEEQPQEIQNLFSNIEEVYYFQCANLLKEAEKLGYTFDYGLDSQPYNLRKMKKIEWLCTDLDNEQYGRQIKETVFEFKEKNRGLSDYEEDEFIEITICLDQYTAEQIENHISAYYGSLDELKGIYGDDSNWIIAECIFEQESGLY
jgi:hypothetical protein